MAFFLPCDGPRGLTRSKSDPMYCSTESIGLTMTEENGDPPGQQAYRARDLADEDGSQNQPLFNLPRSIVAFALVCLSVHFARTVILSGSLDRFLFVNFAFFPARYLPEIITFDLPTLVSPLSYSFLHGDWVHVSINMIWLAIFGSPVAYRLGTGRTVVLWAVTAVAAVLLHLALYWGDTVPLVGASGAVSGFMGAAARFGFRSNRANPRQGFSQPLMSVTQSLRARGVLPFLIVWMVVNYLSGHGFLTAEADAQIAWEAHIGGLLAGFFLIGLVDSKVRSLN